MWGFDNQCVCTDDLLDRLEFSPEYQQLARSLRDELFKCVFTRNRKGQLVPFYDLLHIMKDNVYVLPSRLTESRS